MICLHKEQVFCLVCQLLLFKGSQSTIANSLKEKKIHEKLPILMQKKG